MDESALRTRLDRIERRQYLVLALLAGPYLVGLADLVGVWIAGVVGAALLVVAFAAFATSRRRSDGPADA